MKANPERARQLHGRGYRADEVLLHLLEENRRVCLDEVEAWIDYRMPPPVVEYRGHRVTVMSIAKESRTDYAALLKALQTIDNVDDAIREVHAQGIRPKRHVWRTEPSCNRRRA